VESALLRHPAVAEAAFVGKPDELRGQIVKAFIVLRPLWINGPAKGREHRCQFPGGDLGATVPDAMPTVSAETPGAPAFPAAVLEASAGRGTVLGSVPGAGSGRSLMAQARNQRRFYRDKIGGLGPR
jgi:acyl-CoA synthetase (AMP-forming)/AMP-acid ligase II